MRMLAAITIQPHLAKGKKITPEKLLPFPWENIRKRGSNKEAEAEQLTPEQQRKRMAELVRKLGDEMI